MSRKRKGEPGAIWGGRSRQARAQLHNVLWVMEGISSESAIFEDGVWDSTFLTTILVVLVYVN